MKTPSQPEPRQGCRQKPSKRLKNLVLEAQNFVCLGCDKVLADVEFDHVIPLALGGVNAPDNWAALCPPCHRTKTRGDLRRIARPKGNEGFTKPDAPGRRRNGLAGSQVISAAT